MQLRTYRNTYGRGSRMATARVRESQRTQDAHTNSHSDPDSDDPPHGHTDPGRYTDAYASARTQRRLEYRFEPEYRLA